MNIGKFSVKNPVLIDILMIAIIVMGLLSFIRLPRELMSNISFSWVYIVVPYPGVSAEEIEKNITIKVEEEISDVNRIKRISSFSREGVSLVQVEFEDDVSDDEFARLYQDVRAEFDKVSLPENAMDPWIAALSTADFMPIISVVLKGDVDIETMNKSSKKLQEKLLDIKDISKAELVGQQERKILIEADRDKMESYGISIEDIVTALKVRNLNIPGGTLETGSREYLIRTLGEIKNPNDFGKIIVRRRPMKGSISISDVATINAGYQKSAFDARFNRKKSTTILVSKKAKGNTLTVVDDVKKLIKEFKKTLPEGIDIVLSNDSTILINDSLSALGWNSVMGFATLTIILFLFIGFRNSLITALGIPITFAITFMFMEWYGESINGSSLFALVLVLGMIVDHAIVIIENSYRHRQNGLSKKDAAILGTNEVIKPVIAATGTTLAAFLPLMLMPGIMGKFMRIIPIVVSLALFASTIEALIFLPCHFAEWSGSIKKKGSGFFGKFQIIFKKFISKTYHMRWVTVVLTLCIIIGTGALIGQIKQDLYAEEDWTQFFIDIKLTKGSSRDMTDQVVKRFEERLDSLVGNNEIISISSTIGFLQTETEYLDHDHLGQITVDLAEKKDGRIRPVIEIINDIKRLCEDIPGAESIIFRKVATGPPMDKPISFRLIGENYDNMESLAQDYKQILKQYPELYNIDDNFDKGIPEIQIHIHENRARELGLSVGQIGLYIRNCFEGVNATVYFDEDEEIDVIVKFAKKHRKSIDDITNLKFPTPDGRLIPFSTVCYIKRTTGIGTIRRRNQKREITISADADNKKNIRTIMTQIEEEFNTKHKKLYPEISLKMGGEFADFDVMLVDIARLFAVGIFIMYIILGAQFKSFIQPFMMFFTITFAFVGCILYLVISHTPLSFIVLYAGVALAGICVNDAIILISYINSLRRKGMATYEAVIEGATVRLRPIILTSITTIGGLTPMAIGLGGYSATWAPMASTVIFGLFFSTVGTLVVIPCVYGIFDDLMKGLGFKMRLEGE